MSRNPSVEFYNDLILSKSSKDHRILLWKISNFSSANAAPPTSAAPRTHVVEHETRSAFGSGFQVLLTIECLDCAHYWIRFGLFHMPFKHPVLAVGDEKSRIHFWDLQALEEGIVGPGLWSAANRRRKLSASSLKVKGKARADAREDGVTSTATGSGASVESAPQDVDNPFHGPFNPLKAHKNIQIKDVAFTFRQVAWSPGGEWCVGVGDWGMICLFRRWD